MGKRIRAVIWLLAGVFLAYDLLLWGGLAVTPTIGKQLREQAALQSPIAASYLFLGRHAVVATGRSSQAMAFAASRFSGPIADKESNPRTVVARFLSAQHAIGTLAYYGAPLLLLLSLGLHKTKQKQIRSFGGKG